MAEERRHRRTRQEAGGIGRDLRRSTRPVEGYQHRAAEGWAQAFAVVAERPGGVAGTERCVVGSRGYPNHHPDRRQLRRQQLQPPGYHRFLLERRNLRAEQQDRTGLHHRRRRLEEQRRAELVEKQGLQEWPPAAAVLVGCYRECPVVNVSNRN